MKRKLLLALLCILLSVKTALSQPSQTVLEEDAFFIRSIYDAALTQSSTYAWLTFLTKKVGARLAGSPQAAAAVEYTRQVLDTMGLDKVWIQPCLVPHWIRGEKEQARIVNSKTMGSVDLNVLALGNSVGTGLAGLTAEVIEVKSLEEVEELGEAGVSGKIVFYNRPMNPKQLETFSAYGGAVDQRGIGPSRAAKLGAVGAIVRSMTTSLDDVPHTGTTIYEEGVTGIPAISISTKDAELLSRLLKNERIWVYMRTTCETLKPKISHNVIGEIRGSEKPEEIILIGGHLDSWDVGEGAHDDGAGCVQAMDVLQLLKRLNYKPKRTIRCVLFMNEENGLVGGTTYRDSSDMKKEYHLAAIESDRGGFTPRGFTCEGEASIFEEKFKRVANWLPLLQPYGLDLEKGGSGADISPLKAQKGLLFGFKPDPQRYFDYHHTAIDTLETVNKRELELGAAAMTSLVFLLDKYGLD